ncbi:ATP-binding protein [Celeribacter sp.]|uniref:ATP-binding protein n=1 Tax=Celeribacter sp. TaxID=1890673 RepID=UPI003A92D507
MFFAWLKKFTPRGIYGRAALIILLPVVVLQLVVLVAFSQRYFDDVTEQLMVGVVAEVGLYEVAVEGLEPQDARAAMADLDARLRISSSFGQDVPAVVSSRLWYDVSGRTIERTLKEAFPTFEGVDLASSPRQFAFSFVTDVGRLRLVVDRLRASARNPHQLIVLMLFTGVVITAISIIFLRNQMRPIRRLARAADAFGRGELVPYRLSGATEVRSAGAAFLNMRARIERQIDQRTLMLSGVSHDLRTPLTRMRLTLSMLEAEGAPQEEIDALKSDMSEMERLLDEFLTFARTDAAEENELVDICALVTEAVARAKRAGGDVTICDMPSGELSMSVRPHALARALDNLIGNALRYGTQAFVSLNALERSVVLTVEDDGPGIPEADRERALHPFVRLDGSRNQNMGSGVGLGLSIAVDIARRHGGSLRLSDSEDHGGLRADIVLPRRS